MFSRCIFKEMPAKGITDNNGSDRARNFAFLGVMEAISLVVIAGFNIGW